MAIALVSGASSGIGYELSIILAQKGYDVILVGRNLHALQECAEKIAQCSAARSWIYAVDLAVPENIDAFYQQLVEEKLQVDLLINNAGVGFCGALIERPWQEIETMLAVNMRALTKLCYDFAQDMKRRGGGTIVNVASTGAYQPGPYIAVYYATKAYVLSLSEALRSELAADHIDVLVLAPGATKSRFSMRAGKKESPGAMSAKKVAQIAYRGIEKKQRLIIPGWQNRLAIIGSKCLPGNISANIVKKIQKNLLQ